MKRVLNIAIGGKCFIINEDAYHRLNGYLKNFQSKIEMSYQTKEVMEELECRIAELLSDFIKSPKEVVNISMVEKIVSQLGMPDGSSETDSSYYEEENATHKSPRKLYRDMERRVFGGVCGGLAYYFNLDIVVIRVIMVILLLFGFGFWLYIILWIAVPAAHTATQKCEMHGLPVTAENLRKFYVKK